MQRYTLFLINAKNCAFRFGFFAFIRTFVPNNHLLTLLKKYMMKNRIILCLAALCVALGMWAQPDGTVVTVTAPGDTVETNQLLDRSAAFPGGDQALKQWIAQNMKYPVKAMENGESGRVFVSFIVNKDGSISDAEVVKSVSPTLDAEALRVVGMMPAWIPGVQGGKPVRTKFTLPLTFGLQLRSQK